MRQPTTNPSVERERFSERARPRSLSVVANFAFWGSFALPAYRPSPITWHHEDRCKYHVLVTSKQHHNMVSRPSFNAESNGWIGGSIILPSTDVSVVISAAYHSAINQHATIAVLHTRRGSFGREINNTMTERVRIIFRLAIDREEVYCFSHTNWHKPLLGLYCYYQDTWGRVGSSIRPDT